jgi:hypothetical protein
MQPKSAQFTESAQIPAEEGSKVGGRSGPANPAKRQGRGETRIAHDYGAVTTCGV